ALRGSKRVVETFSPATWLSPASRLHSQLSSFTSWFAGLRGTRRNRFRSFRHATFFFLSYDNESWSRTT
ncbi:unnamed protein product, partial [Amoebophrya sp. A25]